jgi:hypothetical protein
MLTGKLFEWGIKITGVYVDSKARKVFAYFKKCYQQTVRVIGNINGQKLLITHHQQILVPMLHECLPQPVDFDFHVPRFLIFRVKLFDLVKDIDRTLQRQQWLDQLNVAAR